MGRIGLTRIELLLSLAALLLVGFALRAAVPHGNTDGPLARYVRDLSLRHVPPPKPKLTDAKAICAEFNTGVAPQNCGTALPSRIAAIHADQMEIRREQVARQFDDDMAAYRIGQDTLAKKLAYWETNEYKLQTQKAREGAFASFVSKARALIDDITKRELDLQALSHYSGKQAENKEAVLRAYESYFDAVETNDAFKRTLADHSSAIKSGDIKSAYSSLYALARIGGTFDDKIRSAANNADRASSMLSMLGWKWLLFFPGALGVLVLARFLVPRAPATLWPGLMFFTGLGWAVLIDLSVNFNEKRRFLALDHGADIFIGFTLFATIVFLLPYIRKFLLEPWLHGGKGLTGKIWPLFIFLLLILGAIATRNRTAVSAEIVKLLFLFTLAWVLSSRETPLVLNNVFARGSVDWRLLVRFSTAIALVLAVLFGLLFWFKDMGPFLLLGLILSLAFFLLFGWRGFVVYAVLAVVAGRLLALSSSRIVERVAEFLSPFDDGTGQIARLHWFSEASDDAGWFGFGFGKVPWYGSRTAGVPEQIQSDYTFTALVGVVGHLGTLLVVALFAAWILSLLVHLIRRLADRDHLTRTESFLTWFGFFGVLSFLLQAAITILGNIRAIPLTGITWPAISLGATSFLTTIVICAFAYAGAHEGMLRRPWLARR